ncbi:MAG: glycosyltransferase family 32 protein [Chlamydiia bacterium]
MFLLLNVINPLFSVDKVEVIRAMYEGKFREENFVQEDFFEALFRGEQKKAGKDFFYGRWRSDRALLRIKDNYTGFVNKIKDPGRLSASKIPKIIHFIWLGSPLSEVHKEVINSWRYFHPDWTILVWDDHKVENLEWTHSAQKDQFKEAERWVEKADLVRYQILWQFGGIYADTDMICLGSFERLIATGVTFFSGLESPICEGAPYLWSGNAIIGSTKRHKVIGTTIRNIRREKVRDDWTDILIRTGPYVLSHAIRINLEKKNWDRGILILPPTYCFPLPHSEREIVYTEKHAIDKFLCKESLCAHLWEGNWDFCD